MPDPVWDITTVLDRFGVVVLTTVAPDPADPDARCQLEVWPADARGRIAGDLWWSADFGGGRFRPLAAAERHLALCAVLASYDGVVPTSRRERVRLIHTLAEPVAYRARVTDLLRGPAGLVAVTYLDGWDCWVTTALDATVAYTQVGPGTPDLTAPVGTAAWWQTRYAPELAGKEHAALCRAFAATPPAPHADRATEAAAVAEAASLAAWWARAQANRSAPGPAASRPARVARVTPLPDWSAQLTTTGGGDAPCVSTLAALGPPAAPEPLWGFTHPATADPEWAHDDLVAALTAYAGEHELPTPAADRRRLAARVLTAWAYGPAAREAAVAAAAPTPAPAPPAAADPAAPSAPTPSAPPPAASPDPAPAPAAPPAPTPGLRYGSPDGGLTWVLWQERPDGPPAVYTHPGTRWPRLWPSAERLLADTAARALTPTPGPVPDTVARRVADARQAAARAAAAPRKDVP